jgi:hypothetical protein
VRTFGDCSPQIAKPAGAAALARTHPPCRTDAEGWARGIRKKVCHAGWHAVCLYGRSKGKLTELGRDTEMDDRTEVIGTSPNPREVNTAPAVPPTNTEGRTVRRPGSDVDRVESVAYDPYANRRAIAYRVTALVYWIFGLVEGLIAIRFVLKALGANPSAGFAEFIYGITYPLVLPFMGLFGNPQVQGSVLELQSLIALIVYALVAWLLGRLAWILIGEHRSAVETRATSIDSRI